MNKLKVTWEHTKKNVTTVWSYLWAFLCFLWAVVYTYSLYGLEEAVKFMLSALMLGFFPYLLMILLVFIFHWLRSDLYLKIQGHSSSDGSSEEDFLWAKRIGFLFDMYEDWDEDGYHADIFSAPPRAYTAFSELEKISTTFVISDEVRSDIKLFLKYFNTSMGKLGNLRTYRIKTSAITEQEAIESKEDVKALAKKLTKSIRERMA